jgi:hypothetical protein
MLPILFFQMKGKKDPYEGCNREHIPKGPTEPVNPAEDKVVIHEIDRPVGALRNTSNDNEGNDRQQ